MISDGCSVTERVVSTLVIVIGVMATWTGLALASGRLRAAGRASRKTELLSGAMPEGWASWFLGGFSSLTVGIYWLWAMVVLIVWTMAGCLLVGLGLRLFWRA